LWITRKLTGNPNVKFVCEPAVAPKEVEMDANLIKQYDRDFEEAANAPLPDDDEL
jgi:GTP-binding nuclear protein Ran